MYPCRLGREIKVQIIRRKLASQLSNIRQERKEWMLLRQEGWYLSVRGRCPVPGAVVGSESAEYSWKREVLMRDLENCCAHALIALNKQGETLAVCSWTTVLCDQHCDHWGSTSALVSSGLGQYINLKGACSIHLSRSNPLGFYSVSL